MSTLRIALISVHASPLAAMGGKKTGGMNVYIQQLAREFGRRDLQVDIYTRRLPSDTAVFDESLGNGIRVIPITAGGLQPLSPDEIFPHLPEFTSGVIAFATRHNMAYDIIYSHYWLSGWVANRLKAVWGIPFVQMFHTLGHMKNRIATDSTSSNQRVNVETQIIQWADRIIAATPAEYTQLRWLYRASRRKIAIVSPGVDLNQFYPIPEQEAKQRLSIPAETHVLLFVGRIERLKGVDTAIDALALLREHQPQLYAGMKFIIVGGNPADPQDVELAGLRARVNALKLVDHVEFAGAREQWQLPDYYAAASAVVMPSDYESFGMVALEAMATGTPVIASEVGGLAFLVREGETGFLIPVRDAAALAQRMITLLRNPQQLAKMRTAATSIAQQYTWSTIADQLLDVFEDLTANPSFSRHKH